jgi:hypothetical protein
MSTSQWWRPLADRLGVRGALAAWGCFTWVPDFATGDERLAQRVYARRRKPFAYFRFGSNLYRLCSFERRDFPHFLSQFFV